MSLCVTLFEPSGRVITKVFSKMEITVGRSSANDVAPDPERYNQVSRRHGRIYVRGPDQFAYEDVGSTQGSFIDGKELRGTHLLRRGDVITLGRDGPSISVDWPQARETGKAGTHLRQRVRFAPTFPLVFSPSFLPHYREYTRVAAGGFGEVWKAQPNGSGPPYAIKLMHPLLLDPSHLSPEDRQSLVDRFAREARVTRLLAESGAPNIPRVYSWGDDPDRDYLYMVMDLVDGLSFDNYIKMYELMDLTFACRVGYEVCRALDAAHNFNFDEGNGQYCRGIVHRDIKPNNILVSPDLSKVWVIDFGVAGIEEGGHRITATNITVGTYQFLPLESIEGNVISPLTDLWGLTVTLYVALSGSRFPYSTGDKPDIVRSLRRGEATPIRVIRPDLPIALANAIDRSLCIDPRQRVQTAKEWMSILKPYAYPGEPAGGGPEDSTLSPD